MSRAVPRTLRNRSRRRAQQQWDAILRERPRWASKPTVDENFYRIAGFATSWVMSESLKEKLIEAMPVHAAASSSHLFGVFPPLGIEIRVSELCPQDHVMFMREGRILAILDMRKGKT